jgi:urocanate hydratase
MRRWKDNSEVELKELDSKCAEWIDLAQDRGQFLALVNRVVNSGCRESRGIS